MGSGFFYKLNVFYTLQIPKSGVHYIFQLPNADKRSYVILAYYLDFGRYEGGIRLDSVEVGTRLKVTISYSTNYKFINPVLDILINLYGDFPETQSKLLRTLQGFKKEYGFKVSLISHESIIYQLLAGSESDSANNLAELIQLWNNDSSNTSTDTGQGARLTSKSGRPSFQEDKWAWNQVVNGNRPKIEVFREWLIKIKENPKRANMIDPKRQFNRIVKPKWGIN